MMKPMLTAAIFDGLPDTAGSLQQNPGAFL